MGIFLANRDAPSRCTATDCLVRFSFSCAGNYPPHSDFFTLLFGLPGIVGKYNPPSFPLFRKVAPGLSEDQLSFSF